MEKCRDSLSTEIISENLYSLFVSRGYPSLSLFRDVSIDFSYNSSFHTLWFPLVVRTEIPLLITYYDPSRGGLGSSARPLLAMARILFKPQPLYAVLTNLTDYILIEVSSGETNRGDESVIPDFSDLIESKSSATAKFNEDIEKKIVALHLSFG